MILGFTGTKLGATEAQVAQLKALLTTLYPGEVHHGDCVGCDESFHEIVRSLSWRRRPIIHVHPPVNGKHRAFCEGDVIHEPKGYMRRNLDIVEASDILIAIPYTPMEIVRSGTWATVRLGEKKKIPIHIVYPDGKIEIRCLRVLGGPVA